MALPCLPAQALPDGGWVGLGCPSLSIQRGLFEKESSGAASRLSMFSSSLVLPFPLARKPLSAPKNRASLERLPLQRFQLDRRTERTPPGVSNQVAEGVSVLDAIVVG